MPVIELSTEYLDKNINVEEYIFKYLNRNTIPHEVQYRPKIGVDNLVITFRSQHQLGYFVRFINKHFPYFEVL